MTKYLGGLIHDYDIGFFICTIDIFLLTLWNGILRPFDVWILMFGYAIIALATNILLASAEKK